MTIELIKIRSRIEIWSYAIAILFGFLFIIGMLIANLRKI